MKATSRAWMDRRVHYRDQRERTGRTVGTCDYSPEAGASVISVAWDDGESEVYALGRLCLEEGPRAKCRCRRAIRTQPSPKGPPNRNRWR